MNAFVLTVTAADSATGLAVNVTTHFVVDGDFGASTYGAGNYGGTE